MKNVLVVVDERKMGGVSILLEDMVKMLDLSDVNLDILVLHNNGDKLQNMPENVNVIYGTKYFEAVDLTIKEVLKSKNLGLILKKVRLVFDMKTGLIKQKIISERKRILKKKYDIEIAFKDGFTALFVAFGDCHNKIHWLHYDYKFVNANKRYDKLFRKILPKFNKIIAVSKGVMDDFNEIYNLEDKTEVINNLVDVEKIRKLSEKANKSKNKSKLKIVSVGRLHYMKGYDRFIEAINLLKNDELVKNVIFELYGDGPEREALLNKISEYNLDKNIKLMGKTDNPYKDIKDSDLFVLSSLYEPFGLVIVEALTVGVPVLATKNSATGELIDNNRNGIIVENSTEGIYNGLKKVIMEPELINKFKENLKKYDYNKQNDKIIKKINKILK